MIYLSSVTMPRHWPALAAAGIGIMLTPAHGVRLGVCGQLPHWAADNGCYNQGSNFSLDGFMRWLEAMEPAQATCLFAVAPDVVGDAQATLDRSRPVLPVLRQLGWPAAFVAQDGLEELAVPWDEFDVLFVGGTTAWKLSEAAFGLARTARALGKWTHLGRVNTLRRLRAAVAGGYDSADGTNGSFGPDRRVPQLCRWVRHVNAQRALVAALGPEGSDR